MSGARSIGLKALLCSAAGGGLASLGLFAIDLVTATQLRFAGVSDPEAQARALAAAARSVVLLELRLMLTHLVIGVSLGLGVVLAAAALPRERRRPAWVWATVGAVTAVLVHALALCGMVASYPQLYADRWWLGQGVRAALQYELTHRLGPRPFDAVLCAVLGALAAGTLVTLARRVRWRGRRRWLAGLALLGLVAGVVVWRHAQTRRVVQGPPNLLILASDSLRTDRLESPAVMPFSSSLRAQGTLYRFGFVPLARTFPAWVSALTGREPRQTGIRSMFPSIESRRDLGPTLFSELRDQGYFTFVVSDFGGDVFPRFPGGFDVVDAPTSTVDTLACASLLQAHGMSLALLRVPLLRGLFPEARAMASLADPQWLVDRAASQVARARGRPFAGLVFFSTSHFPFVAPYPDYRLRAGRYRGPYLYGVPPSLDEGQLAPEDVEQIRARYDGALRAIDRASERLWHWLDRRQALARTLVIVTGDHGEALLEDPGVFGHGDVIDERHGQFVPILFVGPGVARGVALSAQVRMLDLPATVLDLLGGGDRQRRFGEGISLRAEGVPRPLCLETGIWFWPTRPAALRGQRLEYPGIAGLVEVDAATHEIVLKKDALPIVETAKERGLVLGARLWRERLTPRGRIAGEVTLAGVEPAFDRTDLAALFEERCVVGDPHLMRLMDVIVYLARAPRGTEEAARP